MPYRTPPHIQERKEETKRRILEAAVAVFSERGYHRTTVDDIAQASGTSKGTFYFYFPSKEAVFLELAADLVHKLWQAVRAAEAATEDPDPLHRLRAVLGAVLETFGRHKSLAKILLVEAVGANPQVERVRRDVHAAFAEYLKAHLDAAVIRGRVPAAVNTETAAYAWLGAVNEVVVNWLYTGQPRRLADAMGTLGHFRLGE